MKKPTLPSKPKEPTPPAKVRMTEVSCSRSLYDNLGKLIAEIEKWGAVVWTDTNGSICCATGPVSFDKVSFHQNYDDTAEAKWQQPAEVTMSEAGYARALLRHEAALTSYREKMAAYETRMATYETDLKAYLESQRDKTEEQERRLLKTLQTKYRA